MLEVFRKPKQKYTIDCQIKVMVVRIAEYLAEDKECSNKAIKLIKETNLGDAVKLFSKNTWVYNALSRVLDKHKGKMVLSAHEIEEDFLAFLGKETVVGQARLEGLKAFFGQLREIVSNQLNITESDYEIGQALQQDEYAIDADEYETSEKRAQEQFKNDNAFNKYKDLEGQTQVEYGCWYEPDTIRDLCNPISKTGIINYIFFDDINPNEAFKIQLTRVRSLIEKLARASVVEADTSTICFISKEPGIGQNHFIFCMLSREKDGTYKLLIINPTGESKHKDFYTGLVEFERQTDVKIYITRTVIQKDEGKEGIVSCGPICVELLNHISSLPIGQVNIVLNGSNKESKTEGEGENAITYNVIDVPDVLLPASLKGVIKADVEEYKQSIIRIRESHLKSLEQQSTEIVKAREHGQKLLNKFVLGDKAESEKSLVNKILDISKTTQASNNRLKGDGISASNIKTTITDNDELIAELMQQDELVSFDTEEKQDKSKQSYVNSSVMYAFHNQEKKKVNNSKNENAFNAYKDLGYWYQELDLIRIGEIILKDKKDVVFVKALGRGHRIQSGNSVDAKAVLKNEQAKLNSGKRLVGLYNTEGNHWIAFIVFKDSKGKLGCRYKDSLGRERLDFKKDLEEVFVGIDVKYLSIGKAEQIEELDNAIAAKGLVSCGIFALKNMNILANCSNIEEYEKLKYYTPAEHKKYEAELKGARLEYALLYGQKVYEELSNQENPIKALLQELNIKEMDQELMSDLAKMIKVGERLLRGDTESQSREPKVAAQISKNKSLDEQSSIDKIKIAKEPDKIIPSANDITPKSSSILAFDKFQQDKPEKTGYEENKLKAKLKSEYAKKDSLPKILEDEGFIEQKIEETYVNLMLIEVEKSLKEGKDIEDDGKRVYGNYEDIIAKKTEINLENIFDNNTRSDQQVKEVNKVLIYGRAGIGKTTLCNYVSYKWGQAKLWKDKVDYVFWLPLRSLSGDWYTLYQNDIGRYVLECFIWRYCLGRDDGFSIQDISKVIKEGKVLLILDGYDEIASFHNEKHTAIKDVIDSAIGITNKQAKVIMTSRPNAISRGIVDKFDAEIENVGLKKKDVYKYIKKYRFVTKEKAEGLLALIKQYGHIESIAQVPINLHLLCLIWNNGGLKKQSNITTTELYKEVTSWLMKRYLGKFKDKELDEIEYEGVEKECKEECKLLEELAYCGAREKIAILRKEECEGAGINWDKLGLLKRLGILSGKGVEKSEQEYEFIYLTFQEYFAARHIARLLGSREIEEVKEAVKFINENKYNGIYERVILFIAGLVTLEFSKQSGKQAMQYFWNAMLNGEIDLVGLKQIELLIRCLEEGKCSEGIPGMCKMLRVIKQYSFKRVDSIKNSLNISTQVLNVSRIIEDLICNLEDPDKTVRRAAVFALGKLKSGNEKLTKTVVKALCKCLVDQDWFMPYAAASALGELKLDNDQLIKVMVEGLCKALKGHDKLLSRAAAEALGKLELCDKQLTKVVVETLSTALRDCDEGVCSAAASALGKLKIDNVEVAQVVVKALCKAIGNDDKNVRRCAANALGELKLYDAELSKAVAETLCKALEDTDEYVYIEAKNALGKLKLNNVEGEKVVVEVLYKPIESDDKDVLNYAASVLEGSKLDSGQLTEAVVESLCKALKNPNENACYVASYVLGKLNLENVEIAKLVVEGLCVALKDSNEDVRDAAIYALMGLKLDNVEVAKAVIEGLCNVLGDPARWARHAAAKTLRKLELYNVKVEKSVVEVLSKALGDHDWEVCTAAAKALRVLKLDNVEAEKSVVEVLCKALGDHNILVCDAAADALWRLRLGNEQLAKAVAEVLCSALEDYNKGMRSEACMCISIVLEKCAINHIKLPLTKHNIKLLELEEHLWVFKRSAITLNNNCLTFHYGDYKLVFELDKSDKELPLKVLGHFEEGAEKEGLSTDMLDSLRTGRKWIDIEGIDPEVDKLLSTRITTHKEGILIIKENLELSIISWAEKLKDDLVMLCTNQSGHQSAIEGYLEQNKSLYSGDKKYASPILMVAMVLAHEKPEYIKQIDNIIKALCKKRVGLSAVDRIGNTIAHYAVRYHRKDVLDACIDSGDYSKEVVNIYGINILHTAVYHNMIGELDDKLGENNLDFDKQAESGKYTFTPIELSVATGSIEAIEKIWDMNKSVSASSKWCRENILNVAIEFKKDEVLHYLIYETKYKISSNLVQDAYVYASTANGGGNINAMRILQGSFVKIHKACSISKYSQMTGNTALHEVVSCEEMEHDNKIKVINYLLGQEVGLADVHNKHNQTAKELVKDNKIKNLLNTKKNVQDSKKHEMPELGKVPIKNLILKGGGPKGIAYIGALKEFEKIQKEEGWTEIERVAGTSAGAITAGLCAIGYSAEELEKYLANIKLIELLDSPNIDKLMKLKDNQEISNQGIRNLLKEQGSTGHKLWFEVIKALGEDNVLCTGDKFEGIIEGLIEKKTGKKNFTLGDLGEKVRKGEKGYKELYIVTLNILNAENPLVILSTEEENYKEIRLADAIRASMSIPIVFEPKELRYRDKRSGEYKILKCIDGGVMYNYPIDIFDKVKFRHTGIRGEGQKPIYNEYTMGLSLYKEEKKLEKNSTQGEAKDTKKSRSNSEKIKEGISKAGMEALKQMVSMLFELATDENLKEMTHNAKAIIKHIKEIAEMFVSCESAMNKYWEESIAKRTVRISDCGYGLLDFDLGAEGTEKLMETGRRAVRREFGVVEELDRVKQPIKIEVENVVSKKSSSMEEKKVKRELIYPIPTGIDKESVHVKTNTSSSILSTKAPEGNSGVIGVREISKKHIDSKKHEQEKSRTDDRKERKGKERKEKKAI